MKNKNLIFLTLLISVLMVSVVSAGITGYLVSRGGGIADGGYTATLQKVEGTTAIVSVQTPTGDTELVRVVEGGTAKVRDATISADNLRSGNLFRRGGGNVEIEVVPAGKVSGVGGSSTLCPFGQICKNEWCGLEERPACANNVGGCSLGQICEGDGFCEVEERKFCGIPVNTNHTHLTDFQYLEGNLSSISNNTLLIGLINCKSKFGLDYVVLGGGYTIMDALEKGMITNGPIMSGESYKVELNVLATAGYTPSGKIYATCARLEQAIGSGEPHF